MSGKVKWLFYGIIVIYLIFVYKIINEGWFGSIPWSGSKFIISMSPLLLLATWFYAKEKKNLTFIFILILFVSIVYFYSYNLQYGLPPWENNIYSTVYIEKSQNFTFSRLDAYLTFSNSGATMRETIMFTNTNPVETDIGFDPPDNTVNYSITISREYNTKNLVHEKGIISNNSLYYRNLFFEPSFNNKIVVEYKIKDIKPTGRVSLFIGGSEIDKPKMYMRALVEINQIRYKCQESCVFTITEDSLASPPRGGITKKGPIYTFDVINTKTDRLQFSLRPTERVYPGLRNLIFAFIVGLLASAMTILIKDRDTYLKEFTVSRFRIYFEMDRIKRCITDIIHKLRK